MATHVMSPNSKPSRIHKKMRGLRRGWTRLGPDSATTFSFSGTATGLPHLRQNCAWSGRTAPHLLQPKMTFAGDDVASVSIQTRCLSKRGTNTNGIGETWLTGTLIYSTTAGLTSAQHQPLSAANLSTGFAKFSPGILTRSDYWSAIDGPEPGCQHRRCKADLAESRRPSSAAAG